jgi:hypothetical protein
MSGRTVRALVLAMVALASCDGEGLDRSESNTENQL